MEYMETLAFGEQAVLACAASHWLRGTGWSNMPGSMTMAMSCEWRPMFTRTRMSGATWYHQVTQHPPHLVALTASRSLPLFAKLKTFSQQNLYLVVMIQRILWARA